MAGVTGRTVKQAFAKLGANSWGVAASVTKGVYFRNDQGLVHQPDIVEDLSMGQAFIGTTERGNTLPVETTLSAQSRYADHLYIFDADGVARDGGDFHVRIRTDDHVEPRDRSGR
jgi:hypothetical protein